MTSDQEARFSKVVSQAITMTISGLETPPHIALTALLDTYAAIAGAGWPKDGAVANFHAVSPHVVQMIEAYADRTAMIRALAERATTDAEHLN